jgi:hypothetical protein
MRTVSLKYLPHPRLPLPTYLTTCNLLVRSNSPISIYQFMVVYLIACALVCLTVLNAQEQLTQMTSSSKPAKMVLRVIDILSIARESDKEL